MWAYVTMKPDFGGQTKAVEIVGVEPNNMPAFKAAMGEASQAGTLFAIYRLGGMVAFPYDGIADVQEISQAVFNGAPGV